MKAKLKLNKFQIQNIKNLKYHQIKQYQSQQLQQQELIFKATIIIKRS